MNHFAAIEGADFLAPTDIADIQKQRWHAQAGYVSVNSQFYRQMLGGRSLSGNLTEFPDLPFTDKEMIRADQRENPPFGSYLAADCGTVSRVHRTSGTSGVAMNLALSAADAVMTAKVGARAQTAAGLGPGHRVVHCLNYQLWMGGYTDHATLEETGATVIPYGVGGTEGLIRVIRDLGVTAISCTPSYPAVLQQVLANRFPDLKPRDLGLKLALFGGEPGLDEPAFRQRLEDTWGFAARNANYGVSDVLCNFAGQSEFTNDLHFVAQDVLYPELIDPRTGKVKPWRDGESGELVVTHLAKQCQPLVRFRTGDIIELTGTGLAQCGRSAPRFRVVGRSDDMVVVRGLNVFPAMLAGIVSAFAELSNEYRITLDQAPPYELLPLEVELVPGVVAGSLLAQAVESRIKSDIGVTAKVSVLAPGELPRTEGKTRRVIRTYQ
ncbi:MAG: phenylacetate--CoA ligase family protein [Rhizobiales bacterium]|nr:phenylacetate--CoA ligase family protein [Hyphomicrobiales bacterium]